MILRKRPMAWVFALWSFLIGGMILSIHLDAPHYQYLMTVPGGSTAWAVIFLFLGVAMVWFLIAAKDALYRATLGVTGMFAIIVAMMLGMAAINITGAVNAGPLTWGGVGVLAIVYAVNRDDD